MKVTFSMTESWLTEWSVAERRNEKLIKKNAVIVTYARKKILNRNAVFRVRPDMNDSPWFVVMIGIDTDYSPLLFFVVC